MIGHRLEHDRQHCLTRGILPHYWLGAGTEFTGDWTLIAQDGTPTWSMVFPVMYPLAAGGRQLVKSRKELWASPWVLGANWVQSGTRVRHIPGSTAELSQPMEFGTYDEDALGGKPLSMVYFRVHNLTKGEIEIALGGTTSPTTWWGNGLFRWYAGPVNPTPASVRVIPSVDFDGQLSFLEAWEDRFPIIDSPGYDGWTHTELVCKVNSYGGSGADVTVELYELPEVAYSPSDPQPGGRNSEPFLSKRIQGSNEPVQQTFQLRWDDEVNGSRRRAFQIKAYHEGDTAVQMLAAYARRFRYSE